MKITLINGWRTWHKWWSTRLKIVGLLLIAAPEAVITAWASIPHDIKETIPHEWITTVGIFLVVASSFAQLVRQKDAHARANQDRHTAESKPRDSDVEKRGRR